MKRLFLIIIVLICANATQAAADKVRVSIVKQYTEGSGFVLPEKAIEKKMPCLIPASAKYDFTRQLSRVAQAIQEQTYDHKVFVVTLKYAGAGISINIQGKDLLDSLQAKYYGDFMVGKGHFVILENEDNKDLLKTYFKKDRGHDAVFQRTYEMVGEIVVSEPTVYQATYDERQRKINVKTHVVDGIDCLKPQAPVITPTSTTDVHGNDDAFDIDVELFEE